MLGLKPSRSNPPSVDAMCGRFVLKSPKERIRDQFGAAVSRMDWKAHDNIGPMQSVPIVRNVEGARRADLLRWGLIRVQSCSGLGLTRHSSGPSKSCAFMPSAEFQHWASWR